MSVGAVRKGAKKIRFWSRPGKMDGMFLLVVLLLLAFGLVMLFSSSYVYAYYN